MRLTVNGEETELEVSTLDEVVKAYNLQKGLVVTEVNGQIIDRDQWGNTVLEEGMNIEIVHFVGGG